MIRTVIDNGPILIEGGEFLSDTLTLAGADDIAPGTILARDSVSNKLVLYVKGGSTNNNGIPKVVLLERVISTGAGDKPVNACVKADKISFDRLIIDADGTNANIDAAVIDQLRDYGINVTKSKQLAALDN